MSSPSRTIGTTSPNRKDGGNGCSDQSAGASPGRLIGNEPTREFSKPIIREFCTPNDTYVVIKAADQFHPKTTRPNEMWQTDFTYFKIIGWGWMYLSTVLDDFSRYIIAWKLCSTMCASDVTDTLDMALAASGCDSATVFHKPRLLSDNGPSYIAGELAEYIEAQKMTHVRGAPCHPQTQGKIERWHQTLKNRILLENYFLPGDLEQQIEAFVEHYNHQRYHESLNNVTPADAYFGRAAAIIKQRERIKRQTIEHRRLQHHKRAA